MPMSASGLAMGNYWERERVEKEENKISIEPEGVGKRRRGTGELQHDPQAEHSECSAHPPPAHCCGLKPSSVPMQPIENDVCDILRLT